MPSSSRWAAACGGIRQGRAGALAPSLARIPFSLALGIEYLLSEQGLRVRTTATNVGTTSCPSVGGASRHHGARPRLHQLWTRSRRTCAFQAKQRRERGKRHALDGQELPVRDAVHRRPAPRRQPAESGRRAHDLPAQRVPERRRPHPSGAGSVVHKCVGNHTLGLTGRWRLAQPLTVHNPRRSISGRSLSLAASRRTRAPSSSWFPARRRGRHLVRSGTLSSRRRPGTPPTERT